MLSISPFLVIDDNTNVIWTSAFNEEREKQKQQLEQVTQIELEGSSTDSIACYNS